MSIRSLDLLDLPTIYRYRGEAVSLDTARALTRGNPLGAIGMLSYMNPQRHVYSAIAADGSTTLLGGITHNNGETCARMLYLAPASAADDPSAPELIDHLVVQASSWGVFHVVAELDESSGAFGGLRRAGFSVYASQRIWDVSSVTDPGGGRDWVRAKSVNLTTIQNLHYQIVPALLQSIEPAPKRATGFMCRAGGPCHAATSTGLHGIVLFPLIHPDTTDVADKLAGLVGSLPNRGNRPVYLCVRTYQAWLEHVLEYLGAQPGPRQAIMVKHIVGLIKEGQAVLARQPSKVSVQPSQVSRLKEKKQRL